MRELTAEEKAEMELAGVSEAELAAQWDLFPDQDFVTALGSVVMLKKGQGQERNEGFTPTETPAE